MFTKIVNRFDESYIDYFDIPFVDTMLRHETKPNTHEFGEKQMRQWWIEKDFLGVPGEKIL